MKISAFFAPAPPPLLPLLPPLLLRRLPLLLHCRTDMCTCWNWHAVVRLLLLLLLLLLDQAAIAKAVRVMIHPVDVLV